MVSKKRYIGLLLIILFLILSIFGINYFNSFTQITVATNQPITVSFYSSDSPDEGINYNPSNKKLTINQPGVYKIKKGSYVYEATGDKEYSNKLERIDVYSPANLEINLNYSEEKLAELLAVEEPSIKKALNDLFPAQMQSYSLSNGGLYIRGEWYAATMVSNNPVLDSLQIVFKKTNDQWKLVTNPPEIIVSKPIYPEIPIEIFEDFSKTFIP